MRLFIPIIHPINALSTSLRKYRFRDKIPCDLHNGSWRTAHLYVSSKRVYAIIRNASDISNFLRHFGARICGINRRQLTCARSRDMNQLYFDHFRGRVPSTGGRALDHIVILYWPFSGEIEWGPSGVLIRRSTRHSCSSRPRRCKGRARTMACERKRFDPRTFFGLACARPEYANGWIMQRVIHCSW